MKRLFVAICLTVLCMSVFAQNTLRIHYKNGTTADVTIADIDSLTFTETTSEPATVSLAGSWFWGNVEAGYYELATFNADNTFTAYDNMFSFGYEANAYGWYSLLGNMLVMRAYGYGYLRRYNWFVSTLTENQLTVITEMGPFTYYRLQPDIIYMKVGDTLSLAQGETLIFADGVTLQVANNSLKALLPGTTYILKSVATTGKTWGYKVVVSA